MADTIWLLPDILNRHLSLQGAFQPLPSFQGQVMMHNQRAGVIAGSAHLALQGVSREQAGKYVCTASNVEGDGRSQAVTLQVICKLNRIE